MFYPCKGPTGQHVTLPTVPRRTAEFSQISPVRRRLPNKWAAPAGTSQRCAARQRRSGKGGRRIGVSQNLRDGVRIGIVVSGLNRNTGVLPGSSRHRTCKDRQVRLPGRPVPAFVVVDPLHCAFTDFGGKLVPGLAHAAPSCPRVEASGKHSAVHRQKYPSHSRLRRSSTARPTKSGASTPRPPARRRRASRSQAT